MKKSMFGLSIILAIVLFSNNIIVHGETSPININILQEQQMEIIPVTLSDRKVVAGDDLVVLKATNMASIITETVFISNKDDRDKIMDQEFRQKAAEAICNGIIEYLNGL